MVGATISRHSDVQHTSLTSGLETWHMAEGGHNPEFDIEVASDEEATAIMSTSTAAFANLGELQRHLPLTPPQSSPWSLTTE